MKKKTKTKTKTRKRAVLEVPSPTNDFIKFIIEAENKKLRFGLFGMTEGGDTVHVGMGLTNLTMMCGLIDQLIKGYRKRFPDDYALTDLRMVEMLFQSVAKELALAKS